MGNLTVTEAPAEEPVSLEEAKKHLRVVVDDEDDLINGLIAAARIYCEGVQGRAYVTREYEYVIAACSEIELPMPPFVSLTSVVARLDDGSEEELESDDYELDSDRTTALLTIKTMPSGTEKLIIEYTAGYGEASDVPQDKKQAMLLLIGFWYEHREAAEGASLVQEVPFAVTALLHLDRVNWFA
jgi:uncharacterized phiE125 gp8 family phage protein